MKSGLLTAFSLCLALAGGTAGAQEQSASAFLTRPADDNAPTLNAVQCANHADCTAVLQRAIDDLQSTQRQGVLWIPEGSYRLSGTVTVWTGIRLMGFGGHRPVFELADNTPGFTGDKPHPLFHFAHERPKPGKPVQDGTSDTFYSGFENLNITVGSGNPAAAGVRFHVAQHGILAHLNITMKSGHAALQDVGNVAFDVHLSGGDFGIDTGKTAPGWPFMLMDSEIEGQRVAGIRTREAGMTLERVTIAQTPVAIAIPEGQVDQLFLANSLFRNISDTALQTGNVKNAWSQISANNLGCVGVKRLFPDLGDVAGYREGEKRSGTFVVDRLRLGVSVGADGGNDGVKLAMTSHAGTFAMPATDVAPLPPVSDWVSVRPLGATGDGLHDDTEALQAAVDAHRVLFFPAGRYRLTGTLHLRPDTVLVGSQPFTTQIVLADNTPAFAGTGSMIPMIETPPSGSNVLSGIGISAGAFNPRAAGALWQAGARSLLEDVKFFGGRGTLTAEGKPLQVYPAAAGVNPSDVSRGWGTQFPSLLVRGGGGVFRAVWSASGFAKAGLMIENTNVPGRIYGFSCEHHMRNEVQLHGVSGWHVDALQTEEETEQGRDAVSLEVLDSRDVIFGNLFQYRVSRSVGPADHATEIGPNTAVEFANVHVFAGGRYAFDHSLLDLRTGVRSRVRDFAAFGTATPLAEPVASSAWRGAKLQALATGFQDVTGVIAEADGDVLFTDAAAHRLLRWERATRSVKELAVPAGFKPVVVVSSEHGVVTVLGADSRVLQLAPDGAARELMASSIPFGAALRLPTGGHSSLSALGTVRSASLGFDLGAAGWLPSPKDMRPLLYTSQFSTLSPGQTRLLAVEDGARAVRITADGAHVPFAEVGGTAMAGGPSGEIYLAGEQLLVMDREGRLQGSIAVPERPTAVAAGGDGTLYVGARSTLYSLSATIR